MIAWVAPLALLAGAAAAQTFKIDTRDDIIGSARVLASDLMKLYHGNESGEIPGLVSLPPPVGDYYWWNGAVLMGTMIDYWHWTGDATYNSLISQGLVHQLGSGNDFMPANWTVSMGNDDQCNWGLAAMEAAESQFPNPPSGLPTWLSIAQAVFDTQQARLAEETECRGGLRWQILPFNIGYSYKNSASNACYFNLAARLARSTGNETYAKAASSTWDWLVDIGYLDKTTFAVYDGAHVEKNCTDVNKAQFSYLAAALAQGAASLYNQTGGEATWRDRTQKLIDSIQKVFFPSGVAFEVACETHSTCTTDMLVFKGITHRSLALTAQLAPFISSTLLPVLRSSAQAAVKQCTGGSSGRQCGFHWANGAFVEPNGTGANEQINVLAAVSGLLVSEAAAPARSNSTSASGPTVPVSPTPSASTKPSGASRLGVGSVMGLIGAWAVIRIL